MLEQNGVSSIMQRRLFFVSDILEGKVNVCMASECCKVHVRKRIIRHWSHHAFYDLERNSVEIMEPDESLQVHVSE